jgi:hypothetical protein
MIWGFGGIPLVAKGASMKDIREMLVPAISGVIGFAVGAVIVTIGYVKLIGVRIPSRISEWTFIISAIILILSATTGVVSSDPILGRKLIIASFGIAMVMGLAVLLMSFSPL